MKIQDISDSVVKMILNHLVFSFAVLLASGMPESQLGSKQTAQTYVNMITVVSCFAHLAVGSPFPIAPVQLGSSAEVHYKGYQQRILFLPPGGKREKLGVQVFQGLEHQ